MTLAVKIEVSSVAGTGYSGLPTFNTHWYADVARSTGFAPWTARPGELSPALARVHAEIADAYAELWEHRLV